jgi:NADPH2:quinone reductase
MKAVVVTAAGDPSVLKLTDIAQPHITSPGQVKIQIRAAGINPVDTKVRANNMFGAEFPFVPGCDGSGVIVETGTDVTRFKPGDSVWFCHGGLGPTQGNYTEFNVLEDWQCQIKPSSLDFIQAAAAPLVMITAWESLFTQANLQSNESVFIHAGAGGVGHVAIQLAKWKGARVITTVSSDEKATFVRSLGVDEIINYRTENVQKRILELTDNEGADVVYDTVGGSVFSDSIAVTRHYGRLVTLLSPPDMDWSEARVRNLAIHFTLMLSPWLRNLKKEWRRQGEILNKCRTLCETGKLHIHINQTFPLVLASKAHSTIGKGHTSGKIVLTV